MKWLEMKVMPVWVIDGKSQIAKFAQKEKRQKARDSALQRYEDIKKKIQRDQTEKEKPAEGTWVIGQDDNHGISDDDRAKIVSYRQQERSLSSTWIQEIKEVFDAIGVPWIQATDEGEKLCCMLFLEGKVDAVFSNDTDCLVYGCSKTINSFKIENSGNQYSMPFYDLPLILKTLGFNKEEFLDFCILLGNDFNSNIPNIGPVKAMDLIKTHGSISNLPLLYKKIPVDKSVLNEKVCKDIFCTTSSDNVINHRGKNKTYQIQWEHWMGNTEKELEPFIGKTSARWILRDMQRINTF